MKKKKKLENPSIIKEYLSLFKELDLSNIIANKSDGGYVLTIVAFGTINNNIEFQLSCTYTDTQENLLIDITSLESNNYNRRGNEYYILFDGEKTILQHKQEGVEIGSYEFDINDVYEFDFEHIIESIKLLDDE